MKVTLLAISSRYIHLSPAPFYLAATLAAWGDYPYETEILDHSINEPSEDILSDILRSAPDILGLSAYIWNISLLRKMIPKIKKALPRCHIVLGGPEVSYVQEQTLKEIPEITAVLSGEGEEPFLLLCEAIRRGIPLSSVPSCSFRQENGAFCIGEPYIGKGTPISPLKAGYAEALKGRMAYIEASRGCPFSCAFCLSGRCGGVRFFNLDTVKADIIALSRVSRTVKFVDRTFNADRSRAADIISFILSHYGSQIPIGTCFHLELSGELLDDSLIALLGKAPHGVFQAEIGVQSLHAETLSAIHRSPRTDRLKENIRRLLALGTVHVHLDLIAGLPRETLALFAESFDKTFALKPHMLQLGFLKLLHGAPMRENAEEYPTEYHAEPPYEVISTPVLTEEDLRVIHLAEAGCDRLYNSRRYRRTLALWETEGKDEKSAFALFCAIGARLQTLVRGYTLDDEITLVYNFLLDRGLDKNKLRDAMLLDFIATNSSRLTPSALKREDARLGRIRNALSRLYPPKKAVRRAVALLSTDAVAFVDYTDKDPVVGAYLLHFVSLAELFDQK